MKTFPSEKVCGSDRLWDTSGVTSHPIILRKKNNGEKKRKIMTRKMEEEEVEVVKKKIKEVKLRRRKPGCEYVI